MSILKAALLSILKGLALLIVFAFSSVKLLFATGDAQSRKLAQWAQDTTDNLKPE